VVRGAGGGGIKHCGQDSGVVLPLGQDLLEKRSVQYRGRECIGNPVYTEIRDVWGSWEGGEQMVGRMCTRKGNVREASQGPYDRGNAGVKKKGGGGVTWVEGGKVRGMMNSAKLQMIRGGD